MADDLKFLNKNLWKNRCLLWSDCGNLTWEDFFTVEETFAAIDSGISSGGLIRVKERDIKKLNKLNPEKKKKLITVISKVKSISTKQTKEKNININVETYNITVEDIKMLMKEVLKVTIEVVKIKNK